MPLFTYTAIDRSGNERTGEKTAKDLSELAHAVREEGFFLIRGEDVTAEQTEESLFSRANEWFERLVGVPLFEKLVFTRNLSVMIHAGLPLTRSLNAIAEETKSPVFRKAINDITRDVTKGHPFAEALSLYPDIFGDLFIHMVQAGEASGKLDQVLNLLARQMKKDYDLRARVRGALTYPVIVISVLLIIGALMMLYVVPTLSQALRDLGAPLPFSTQVIIFISDVFVNYSAYVLAGAVLAGAAFIYAIRSAKGKPIWDAFILHIPLFGPLIRHMNAARIARILAYLLESGVPIVRSLEITSGIVGNVQYRRAMGELGKEVIKGSQMGAFFHSRVDLFDPVMAEMVSAGEEAGKISPMLLEVALFFEQDVQETTKNLSSIIEPFLMVVIGSLVGFFAISVLQPIYGSLSNI